MMFETLRHLVTSLAIASLIGTGAQAYASSSTGSGAAGARISTAALAISDVRYESSQAFVTAVRFHISSGSGTIRIRLNPNGGWISCANSSGEVLCPTGNFPASAVEQLSVVAS
jgi:hypothetical protein